MKKKKQPRHPDSKYQGGMLVTLDPGLRGTGIAIWDSGKLFATKVVEPTAGDWWTRSRFVADAIYNHVCFYMSDRPAGPNRDRYRIIMETTQFMGSGMAWKTGDMQKLTFLNGVIYERLRQAKSFYPVMPNEWKGQLPKDVVIERAERELGKKFCARLGVKTHAWDAVGIGLWAMGRL